MTDAPDDPPPADPSKCGRPSKLTPAFVTAFVDLIGRGNFRGSTAERLGVSRKTVERWMQAGRRHPDGVYGGFRGRVLAAESKAECRAVARIKAAGADDVKHLQWWLERKYPQRWGRGRGELVEVKRRLAALERDIGRAAAGPPWG